MFFQSIRNKKALAHRDGIDSIENMLDSTWDLSTRFPALPESPYSRGITVFNLFFERLNQVVATILKNVVRLSALAPDLFLFSKDFRGKSKEQELKISGIVKAGRAMADQVEKIAENTRLAAKDSEEIQKEVQTAKAKGELSMDRFARIKHHVQELAEIILELGDNSKSIGSIIDVINNIADETNILSLNARIEAARDNADGKGFKIIAEEVAALAKQSKEATGNIRDRLTVLSRKVDETVTAVKRVEENVASGEKLITDANQSLQNVHDRFWQLTEKMSGVEASTMIQANDVKTVSRDITGIETVVIEQTRKVDTILQIAEQVNATCNKMIVDTGIFHLTGHRKAKTEVENLSSDTGVLDPARQIKEKALADFVEARPFVELAYITDENGRQVTDNIYSSAVKKRETLEKGFGKDWSEKEWFEKPASFRQTFVSKVYRSSATDQFCFTISVPLFKSRTFCGVLGIDISFKDILEI